MYAGITILTIYQRFADILPSTTGKLDDYRKISTYESLQLHNPQTETM
jgi:hypothetical protein